MAVVSVIHSRPSYTPTAAIPDSLVPDPAPGARHSRCVSMAAVREHTSTPNMSWAHPLPFCARLPTRDLTCTRIGTGLRSNIRTSSSSS
ncbi:hypothetical protein FOMPIDRAFT_1025340 [Fomitopsis schrenkii]|uniref:Uncharacterized protein n=1 Tax=Fomitopsis schrenkii TaxID=2126942 RepID=S8F432_FOMSC|nr:hypothetical protein FOMPIDRAFT_1025340 [Fomitopsis schrenkii]